MAHAVLDGTFDFAKATLSEGQPAETVDEVIAQNDLSQLLAVQSDPTARLLALPAALSRFLGGSTNSGCVDLDPNCQVWAASGACLKNAAFMQPRCGAACGAC